MRHVKALGGAAIAAILVCGAITASASAEVPELGRCTKVTPVQEGKRNRYRGGYKNKNCTKPAPSGNGRYEWMAGPGANNKFAGASEEPEPVLETTGGQKMECSLIAVTGEYTGPKTAKAKYSFGGCQIKMGSTTQNCQTTPAKEGELENPSDFEMELGQITGGSKPVVGWDLKSSNGPLYTYVCANKAELPSQEGTIEGSVIGTLVKGFYGTDVNKMSIYANLRYSQAKGHQSPESFEGMPADVLTSKILKGTTSTTEQTGLETLVELHSGPGETLEKPENQEPLEVKTVP